MKGKQTTQYYTMKLVGFYLLTYTPVLRFTKKKKILQ